MGIKKIKRKSRTKSKTRRLLVEFYNVYDPNCSCTHNSEQLENFLESKQSYPTNKYAMFRRHWCMLVIRRNENVPLTEAFQIYDSWRQGRRNERYAYYNIDSNDQHENYNEDDEDDDEDDKNNVVDDDVVDAATQRKPKHSSTSSPPKKKRGKTTHDNAAAAVTATREEKEWSDAAVAIEEQERNASAVKAEVDAKVKANTAVIEKEKVAIQEELAMTKKQLKETQEELEKLAKEKETKDSAEKEKKTAEKVAPSAAAARQKEESSVAAVIVTTTNNNNDDNEKTNTNAGGECNNGGGVGIGKSTTTTNKSESESTYIVARGNVNGDDDLSRDADGNGNGNGNGNNAGIEHNNVPGTDNDEDDGGSEGYNGAGVDEDEREEEEEEAVVMSSSSFSSSIIHATGIENDNKEEDSGEDSGMATKTRSNKGGGSCGPPIHDETGTPLGSGTNGVPVAAVGMAKTTSLVAATAIVCMGASTSASVSAIQQLPPPPLPPTLTNTNTDTNTLLLFPTGTIISKQFEEPDGPYYEGSIISYDTQRKFYQIKYNDGDREDFTHDEVHYHRPTQTSTSSANDSINKHISNWNKKFQQLSAYKKTKGNANVPQSYQADPQLGSWVHNQRKAYNNKKLSNERIEQLGTINFVWDAPKALWFGMYNELISYQKQYHDTLVPRQYTENRQLYYWVIYQRSAYNDGTLSEERTDLLNLIGFVWSTTKT